MSGLFKNSFLGMLLGRNKREKPQAAPVQRIVDEQDVSEAEREQNFRKKQSARSSINKLGLTGGPLGDTTPPRTSRATLI